MTRTLAPGADIPVQPACAGLRVSLVSRAVPHALCGWGLRPSRVQIPEPPQLIALPEDSGREDLTRYTAQGCSSGCNCPHPGPHSAWSMRSLASSSEASPRGCSAWLSSPISSGRTDRHRLNRLGDRQLNRALHIIAINRMRSHPPTQAYVQRRLAEGKTERDIRRCIKRYLARHLYRTSTRHPNRIDKHRSVISVPTSVMRGLSRSLAEPLQLRPGQYEARTVQIPKLTVHVRSGATLRAARTNDLTVIRTHPRRESTDPEIKGSDHLPYPCGPRPGRR